jgi:hypothetical protein
MISWCWKCGDPVRWNAAIGDHCANPRCDVVDALDRAEETVVRIMVPAPAAAVPQMSRRVVARDSRPQRMRCAG